MALATKDIDLKDIELAIADRFRLLRFAPRLERRFSNDSADDRCRHMVKQNYIGMFIYHCFLFSDCHAVPDVFSTDLLVHFVVMTPLLLCTNIVLGLRPPQWVREGIEALLLVILTFTIVGLVAASRSPLRDLIQLCVILVVLFAIIVQKLRFWYVLPACLATLILFGLGATTLVPMSLDRFIMLNSVFVGVLAFSLVGAYNLEHEERMGYLLRVRDKLRNRELETLSLRDALTGIGNRRALDAAFGVLLKADASSELVSVMLLDIDHFKRFNDTNGHQEGDACLVRMAGLIAGSLRGSEGAAYRFGGEEFVVLLSNADPNEALLIAERIRLSVARARIPAAPDADTCMSVSIGVASGRLGGAVTPETLIAAADRELYRAKSNGRDQVSPALSRTGSPVARSGSWRMASDAAAATL